MSGIDFDEIEKLAADWSGTHLGGAGRVARALLAVLPVVRAAEEWAGTCQSGHLGLHDQNMNALADAITAMRVGLESK